MKKQDSDKILRSWIDLNEFIRFADEEQCQAILKAESEGKRRKQFMLRIHSRLNKVRADREREELEGRAAC